MLAGKDGALVELTRTEGCLLAHFLSKPGTLCTRQEIGGLLYGPDYPIGDRALDIVVNRLRNKLLLLGGPAGWCLIKTEFRRGYALTADVMALPHEPAARPSWFP